MPEYRIDVVRYISRCSRSLICFCVIEASPDMLTKDEFRQLLTDESWQKELGSFFESDHAAQVLETINACAEGVVAPRLANIFSALNACALDQVKVVIVGQDPYHGIGQATGMAFAVPEGVQMPPSLRNILKEALNAYSVDSSAKSEVWNHLNALTDLTHWASQGVLLLNAVLTVKLHAAGSHRDCGWEHCTEAVIKLVNEKREGVVFLLWGKDAQDRASCVDESKHLVLKSAHPSGLSAYRGFIGNRHFSQANEYLSARKGVVEWIPTSIVAQFQGQKIGGASDPLDLSIRNTDVTALVLSNPEKGSVGSKIKRRRKVISD